LKKNLILLFCVFSAILAGCNDAHQPEVQIITSPTILVKPTATLTVLAATGSSSISPTFTSPSRMPFPTLSRDEAYLNMQKLLQDNAGCRLPCWWDITPGKTTWADAEIQLNTFSWLISVDQRSDDLFIAYAHLPLPKEKGTLSHTYYVEDGIVTIIYAYVFDWMPTLYLSNFLSEYGHPDEIFVRTFRDDENGSRPYEIILFYADLGILMEYSGGNPNENGDKVQNCFEDMYSPFVYIWSSKTPLTSTEAIDKFLDTTNLPYPVPLKEATGVSINEFYETYKTPSHTTCLETPRKLWP
jgi:hypothetical protein